MNHDVVPHTATAADGTWDSGEVAPGEAFVLVVARGHGDCYVCRYHPTMVGVLEAARAAGVNAQGNERASVTPASRGRRTRSYS